MTDEQKPTRKLRAILSADVKGYSLLMADDEAYTVKKLKEYRDSMSVLIQSHSGRVVDTVGDNLLAEFESAVEAVECAVEMQVDLKKKNDILPADRRLEFRIGINIGDVIQDGDRIFGDGVNIAARIEGLADAGGVCISRNAYDHVRAKLELGYEYLGEHSVKNITQPVRVYKVLMDPADSGRLTGKEPRRQRKKWFLPVSVVAAIIVTSIVWHFYQKIIAPDIEPVSVSEMDYPLPDKPSIAVLPFKNMSGDPHQEYFSDGITEQIITGLSNVPKLFVMSRNATFTYKGKPVKPKQVAEELGVQYVLEGSVQEAGNRIRITAQLIDALEGHHLWAEQYDRELNDIFALQDEITIKIMTTMRVKLTSGEQARVFEKGTDNLKAYFKYLRAREHFDRNNKEDNVIAQKMLEEAIALDPKFALAQSLLGATHMYDVLFELSKSPKVSIGKAIKLAKKAISLDESLARPHALLAFLYVQTRQYEKAAAECERALELGPNDERAHSLVGAALRFSGRWAEAIPVYENAIRLNPFPHSYTYFGLGLAYCFTGQFEKGIEACRRATNNNPNDLFAHVVLTAAYGMAGRDEEARAAAERVLKIEPKFNTTSWNKVLKLKNQSDKRRYIEALQKAGLPEHPPPQLPDKPSIAVLAFDNLSGDPDQDYISDGLAENIITALSKVGELFIIARNSSFTYKGKPVKVQQIGRELGVRYVLEGSVQKSKDRLRITAQLVDAINGRHLWAESYYRDVKDIFDIQDEITKKIVTSLLLELSEGDQARIREKQSKTLEGFLKMAQATSLWRVGSKESLIRFGQLAQEFKDLEPESSAGYRLLGWYHWGLAARGISPHPREEIKKSHTFALKAVSVDESDSLSYGLLGATYRVMRNYEKAIESSKRAVELDPNGAMVRGLLGQSYYYAGQLDKALVQLKQAIRLNPFPASWYYAHLGLIYRQKGQYEDAIREFKNAIKRSPNHYMNYIGLATVYVFSNQIEEAEAVAKKILELYPDFSVKRFSKALSYKQAEKSAIVEALRKSGLPE